MRGYAEFNFPLFRRACAALRARGYTIVSPHEMDEEQGYFWEGFTGFEDLTEYNFDITERLTADIVVIGGANCNGVIALEGWEESSGSRAEVMFAFATGRKVYRFFEETVDMPDYQLIELTKPAVHSRYGALHDLWFPEVAV